MISNLKKNWLSSTASAVLPGVLALALSACGSSKEKGSYPLCPKAADQGPTTGAKVIDFENPAEVTVDQTAIQAMDPLSCYTSIGDGFCTAAVAGNMFVNAVSVINDGSTFVFDLATGYNSMKALHLQQTTTVQRTSNGDEAWGGVLQVELPSVDASAYKGFSFWVKGAGPADFSFWVNPELQTTRDAIDQVGFACNLNLTSSWTRYDVTWSDVKDIDNGGTFKPTGLRQITWGMGRDSGSNREIDTSVDDLYFLD
jgi:hypothetical protein